MTPTPDIPPGTLAVAPGHARVRCQACGKGRTMPSPRTVAEGVLSMLGWTDDKGRDWRCQGCGPRPKVVQP